MQAQSQPVAGCLHSKDADIAPGGAPVQRFLLVLKAVNSLPPRCKLIFKMVKEDELSCNEVADILGLSNKTVFAQLAIALKKLDEALGNI